MATLNKYRRISLRQIGRQLHRRAVTLRLHLHRMAGIGMGYSAVHDIQSFFVMAVSAVHGLLGRIGGLLRRLFYYVADKTLAYTEPVAELLARAHAEAGMILVRIGSRRREPTRLIPVMMLAAATLSICTLSFFGVGLKVSINGVSVGYVSSKGEMEEILAGVEDRVAEYLGSPYSLNLDVTYSIGYDDGVSSHVDSEQIASYVMSGLDNVSAKYVLTVDGVPVGANKSRSALELLRQRMLEQNASAASYKGGKIEFVQDVRVVPQGSMDAAEMTIDEIQAKLTGNTSEPVVYTVQSGDTVSGIAQKYSTSTSAIVAANPGLQAEKIHVGQEITITASVPMLSVKETVTEHYVRRIGYETEKRTTDQLYTTQSRVVVSGQYGEANVTADVVYINGQEQSRVVMDWQVTKDPVTEVIEVGTKKPPAKTATGTFRKPSNGVFSSGYGYRRNLGDFHTGVDFAGAVGTPIYAADGGKVTFAGRKGNYGYCVFITHDNGYVTLYAHCSKLLVKQGQSVAKGETIAKVGATGRVTGPHLHFEVRKNGQTVNPLNYISK